MSTKNKTKNLKLPQYQNDDLFDMKEVNEAYKIIDESYKEQNDNYKQAIETSTINGAIDNLELIDARKGKRTLGEKISEIDSQLDNIVYIAKNKNGMLINFNFFKDDFNPSIPQEVENGTKRRSTVVTKNGVINGLAYNINAPLTNSTTTVDVNINGVKKSEISIPNNKYSDYVLLSSPLTVLKGQAISLTLRSSGNDQTLRQIQFTVEYEIN